jgi:hypothetical protein
MEKKNGSRQLNILVVKIKKTLILNFILKKYLEKIAKIS